MEKSLSERIAAKVLKKKLPLSHGDQNQNRAVFLLLRQEIKKALDDGWPMRSIWEILHEEGKVTFGYDSFRRYTRRLIALPLIHLEHDTTETPKRKTDETPQIRGFTFNPSPKKEDLY